MSERKLGLGGYATVFMAIDRWNERQVACKVVKLKQEAVGHYASHHFNTLQHACLARTQTALLKEPHPVKLWREVELLKTVSHVSPPEP